MKNSLLYFLFLVTFQTSFAQTNLLWKGYFSYTEIKDVSESPTKLYAASENALFSKNLSTNDIKTTNTIDGLSGQTITALHHSIAFNKTIVGYENGLLIVINDVDGSMLQVVDIINKSLAPNIKRVNHFMEHDGIVYVSCDFGIVQYKLATLEFGDTYFIGPAGQEVKVFQTTVFNNEIYAVTQYNGIRKASVSNPNLIDFAQWQLFDGGYWNGIVTFNNQLIAIGTNNKVYSHTGTAFLEFANLNQPGLDIRATTDGLIVTTLNHVYVYGTTLNQIAHIQSAQVNEIPVTFTCATIINGVIYIGTNENGIVSSPIINTTAFEFIKPDGPSRNNIFAIQTTTTDLWAVYGGYSSNYNPFEYYVPASQFGISKYKENGWLNIPYSEVLGAKAISRIIVNPTNENEVYASSYFSGLLKIENEIPTILYNNTNSGLESLSPNFTDIRINGTAFDRNGNLWVTNSLIKNGLKVLKTDGQWQSYNMENISANYLDLNFGRLTIDKNGTKWMATSGDGAVAFNESANIFKKIISGPDLGNLPSNDVRVIAIDARGEAWIGTNKGLRKLSSVGSYNSDDQMKANPIIIVEDGLNQELLFEQFITDIVVDGANQKWIGTADSGVFLFSSNGQETIYHFTKDNSPLPSNAINDIDINSTSGEVFIATDRGMVSFKGTSTKPSDNLQDVYVYPNPVRPEFVGTVKIAGLLSKANVKITDIEGNLVYETTSIGGTIEWDTTAFGKYKVASGVYMIFIAAEDASETAVKKVMIIR